MRKLFNWLFPDYSNFGTTKITEKMIKDDLDSLYSYFRASGFSPKEAIANAITKFTTNIFKTHQKWSDDLRNQIYEHVGNVEECK